MLPHLQKSAFPSTYEIIGFDNSPIASEAILPITTVGQQIDVIAKTAMDLLVRQMDEQKKRAPSFTIEFCRIASFSGSV